MSEIVFDASALQFWGPFNPDSIREPGRMLGGTELVVMQAAKALADMDNDVIVFAPSKTREQKNYDGVTYAPAETLIPYLQKYGTDVCITANCGFRTLYARDDIKVKLKVDYISCCDIFATREYIDNTDRFLVSSQFQQHYLNKKVQDPTKFFQWRFGYDPDLIGYNGEEIVTTPFSQRENRIIYMSSPDRGLGDHLKIFAKLRKANPTLETHIYYDVNSWLDRNKYSHFEAGVRAASILRNINLPGVVVRGPLCYSDMMQEVGKAKCLVYPFSASQPTETYPRVVLECAAAGTPCFLSDNDCMQECYKGVCEVHPINIDYWAKSIDSVLHDRNRWQKISQRQLTWAVTKTWKNVMLPVDIMIQRMLGDKEK